MTTGTEAMSDGNCVVIDNEQIAVAVVLSHYASYAEIWR